MATRMQQRRGTAAQWTGANPILAVGEIGFETDTGQFKIGDGTNHWDDLSYFKNIDDLGGNLDDYILLTEKGQPNGVAELDANGQLPQSQVPYIAQVTVHAASNQADRLSLNVEAGDLSIQTDNGVIYLLNSLPSSNNANWSAITLSVSEINEHINDTTNVHGIADTGQLATISYADGVAESEAQDAVSTHNAVTTNVHGITDTADLATKAYADNSASSAVSTHDGDTTNVHGIADTSLLATKSYADNAGSSAASSAVSTHNSDTTNVHGIADTSALALTADVNTALALKQDKVTGVSDTEIGYLDGVTSAIQTQIDSKASTTSLSTHESDTSTHGVGTIVGTSEVQTLTNKTISSVDNTISVTVSNITDLTASASELNTLDGVLATTSEINKLNGLTASTAELNLLDGVTASTTELNYVDGVTSAIQTQIDSKAPTASPTFTGTVSGITKSMVGLGNVDNTSDADKPVSTATQIALDLKANLASPTFTGTVNAANLTLTGDLTVGGTTTTVNATDLVVSDPLIYIGEGNSANLVDLGLVSSFNDGTYQHAGLVRDSSDSKWKLFKGVTDEPTTTVNFSQGSLDALAVGALEATSLTVGDVSNTEFGYLNGVTSAIQTQIDAKAPSASPTFTGTVVLPSDTSIGSVSSTEIGYLDGVTSAIQTQIDTKLASATAASTYAPLASPTFTGTVVLPSATSIGSVSNTEIGYLDGVTSAIQTQIDAKAPIASPTFTGTVTVAASGIAFTDGTQTKEGVPSRTTINSVTDTYNLSTGGLALRDTLIECNKATGFTVTIPANSTTAYPVGTSIDILQTGAGQVTIAGAAGVTVNGTPGLKLRTQWSSATLFKRATDTWVVMGDLTA